LEAGEYTKQQTLHFTKKPWLEASGVIIPIREGDQEKLARLTKYACVRA